MIVRCLLLGAAAAVLMLLLGGLVNSIFAQDWQTAGVLWLLLVAVGLVTVMTLI